jgi:hypothetical protein
LGLGPVYNTATGKPILNPKTGKPALGCGCCNNGGTLPGGCCTDDRYQCYGPGAPDFVLVTPTLLPDRHFTGSFGQGTFNPDTSAIVGRTFRLDRVGCIWVYHAPKGAVQWTDTSIHQTFDGDLSIIFSLPRLFLPHTDGFIHSNRYQPLVEILSFVYPNGGNGGMTDEEYKRFRLGQLIVQFPSFANDFLWGGSALLFTFNNAFFGGGNLPTSELCDVVDGDPACNVAFNVTCNERAGSPSSPFFTRTPCPSPIGSATVKPAGNLQTEDCPKGCPEPYITNPDDNDANLDTNCCRNFIVTLGGPACASGRKYLFTYAGLFSGTATNGQKPAWEGSDGTIGCSEGIVPGVPIVLPGYYVLTIRNIPCGNGTANCAKVWAMPIPQDRRFYCPSTDVADWSVVFDNCDGVVTLASIVCNNDVIPVLPCPGSCANCSRCFFIQVGNGTGAWANSGGIITVTRLGNSCVWEGTILDPNGKVIAARLECQNGRWIVTWTPTAAGGSAHFDLPNLDSCPPTGNYPRLPDEIFQPKPSGAEFLTLATVKPAACGSGPCPSDCAACAGTYLVSLTLDGGFYNSYVVTRTTTCQWERSTGGEFVTVSCSGSTWTVAINLAVGPCTFTFAKDNTSGCPEGSYTSTFVDPGCATTASVVVS